MTSAWYKECWTGFSFPGTCSIDILSPIDAPALDIEAIKTQIENPFGPSLQVMSQEKKNIVFVVDDLGRPTPASAIISIVLSVLSSNPIERDIKFIIATGSHRPLKKHELQKKLGADIVADFEIFSHDAFNSPIKLLGYLDDGFPCYANGHAATADLIIGIGSVIPHSCHGFGGGAKLFLPGIAGIESIALLHGFMKKRGRGKEDPSKKSRDMRTVSEAFAALMPPIFDINVVVNSKREISGVFAGDYKKSFIKAREFAKKLYTTPIAASKKNTYDFIIVNEYPLDADPVQSDKSYWVRKTFPNSVFIHLNECSDGLDYHGWKEMRKQTKLSKMVVLIFRFIENFEHMPFFFRNLFNLFPFNTVRKFLFKKFVIANKIDFDQFYSTFKNQSHLREYHVKPSYKRHPWFYSKNYPSYSFYKKYKNGCLIDDWNVIYEFIQTHNPNAKIAVLTCAPMQIPEIK